MSSVLYVLDQPSIGLHERDNDRLIKRLHRCAISATRCSSSSTTRRRLRPRTGSSIWARAPDVTGGRVIAEGTPDDVKLVPESITGRYLSGVERIDAPAQRRTPSSWVKLTGAKEHNLRNVSCEIPLCVMVAVTGVSGRATRRLLTRRCTPRSTGCRIARWIASDRTSR